MFPSKLEYDLLSLVYFNIVQFVFVPLTCYSQCPFHNRHFQEINTVLINSMVLLQEVQFMPLVVTIDSA